MKPVNFITYSDFDGSMVRSMQGELGIVYRGGGGIWCLVNLEVVNLAVGNLAVGNLAGDSEKGVGNWAIPEM